MIFYGPEGAGKKTRVYSFLERVFDGKNIYKLKSEDRVLKP
jgi:type II secretory ATPase GspE/PulE/Tfp pilus assembly ATPase PilB-like protein